MSFLRSHSGIFVSESNIHLQLPAWGLFQTFLETGGGGLAAKSCHTPDLMDCNLPGSSVQGISKQEHWSGLLFPSPGDLPDVGSNPRLLHCQWIIYRWTSRETPSRSWAVFLPFMSPSSLNGALVRCQEQQNWLGQSPRGDALRTHLLLAYLQELNWVSHSLFILSDHSLYMQASSWIILSFPLSFPVASLTWTTLP